MKNRWFLMYLSIPDVQSKSQNLGPSQTGVFSKILTKSVRTLVELPVKLNTVVTTKQILVVVELKLHCTVFKCIIPTYTVLYYACVSPYFLLTCFPTRRYVCRSVIGLATPEAARTITKKDKREDEVEENFTSYSSFKPSG